MSDNSDEQRIQEIMRKKNCSRENAEARLRSAQVANFVLSPQLFKPMAPIPKPQQVEEPIEEEQVEETEETETIEDPFFEQKQSQLEQKQRILNLLEKQANELDEFSNYLAVPQWREVFKDYINLLEFVIKGYAVSFALLVKMSEDGQKLNFEYEFYDKKDKPIIQINPEVAVQSVQKEGK